MFLSFMSYLVRYTGGTYPAVIMQHIYDAIQRRSFSPFVISKDGLLGFDAKNLLKQLARHL